jgi:hypothetical protein
VRRRSPSSDEQIAFVFDEIATGVAAVEAELAKAAGTDRTKRAPRPRKELGAHLERRRCERIAQGWPISRIDALMPWHFKS